MNSILFDPKMKILALAPHTDDVELGCGGTLAKLKEAGAELHVAAFSTASDSLPPGFPADTLKKEFLASTKTMGVPEDHTYVFDFQVRRLSYSRQEVLDEIIRLRKKIQPNLIFLPSPNDLHQDHQVVSSEGLRAFKEYSVLAYELPWNHIHFSAQAFVTLQEKHVQKKLECLQQYKSQIFLERSYFKPEFVQSQCRMRGAQIKADFAEAFEVLRIRF